MNSVLIKKLASPDQVRTFEKGRFELVEIGGLSLGRATYEPGWRWSVHVGPIAGTASCQVSHVGLVLQGGPWYVWMTALSSNLNPETHSPSRPGTTVGC